MKRLIAGRRAVEEALAARPGALAVVYAAEADSRALRGLAEQASRSNVRVEYRTGDDLDALAHGIRHQGVLAVTGEYPYADLESLLHGEGQPLIVALDQVQDPHNFGAIVRTAVGLGARGVITLKDRACPVTPTVVRASAGATERARIARVTNLARTLDKLRSSGFQVVGLAGESPLPLTALPPASEGRVLVVGSEGKGLRRLVRERCDHLARIELPGPISSLNASVAAGIAMYALLSSDARSA